MVSGGSRRWTRGNRSWVNTRKYRHPCPLPIPPSYSHRRAQDRSSSPATSATRRKRFGRRAINHIARLSGTAIKTRPAPVLERAFFALINGIKSSAPCYLHILPLPPGEGWGEGRIHYLIKTPLLTRFTFSPDKHRLISKAFVHIANTSLFAIKQDL